MLNRYNLSPKGSCEVLVLISLLATRSLISPPVVRSFPLPPNVPLGLNATQVSSLLAKDYFLLVVTQASPKHKGRSGCVFICEMTQSRIPTNELAPFVIPIQTTSIRRLSHRRRRDFTEDEEYLPRCRLRQHLRLQDLDGMLRTYPLRTVP